MGGSRRGITAAPADRRPEGSVIDLDTTVPGVEADVNPPRSVSSDEVWTPKKAADENPAVVLRVRGKSFAFDSELAAEAFLRGRRKGAVRGGARSSAKLGDLGGA